MHMIRIAQVRAELDYASRPLARLAAKALRVREEEIASVRICLLYTSRCV